MGSRLRPLPPLWGGVCDIERAARLGLAVYETSAQFSGFPNGQTPQPIQAGAEVRQIAARAVAQPVEPYSGRNPGGRRIRLDSARHRARAERIADGARGASGDERWLSAPSRQAGLERPRD